MEEDEDNDDNGDDALRTEEGAEIEEKPEKDEGKQEEEFEEEGRELYLFRKSVKMGDKMGEMVEGDGVPEEETEARTG